jgi:Zn-dependent protease with chaperone function
LVLIAGCSIGCSTLPELAPPSRRWTAQHGGLVDDASLQARAAKALRALRHTGSSVPLEVRVLDESTAAAYAWKSGALFVTRGLVESVDGRELVAALAHEIGHLVARAHPDLDPRDEFVADRLGREILARNGLPPETMTSLLSRLEARSRPALARRLRERVVRLKRAIEDARHEIAMN